MSDPTLPETAARIRAAEDRLAEAVVEVIAARGLNGAEIADPVEVLYVYRVLDPSGDRSYRRLAGWEVTPPGPALPGWPA